MAPNQHAVTSFEHRASTPLASFDPRTSAPVASLQSIDGALFALRDGPDDVLGAALQVIQAVAANASIRYLLVDAGVTELLVDRLASCSSTVTRLALVRTLHPFSVEKRIHSKLESTDIMPALLELLTVNSDITGDSLEALRLLQCLLVHHTLRDQFMRLNGISTVATLALSRSHLTRDLAVFVLWMLTASPTCRAQFPGTKALEALAQVLEQGSGECIDLALSAMARLAENEACRDALIALGVLAALPRVVQCEERDEVVYRAKQLEELLVTPQAP